MLICYIHKNIIVDNQQASYSNYNDYICLFLFSFLIYLFVQHESYHFHEFMQCLKMKVDSLINSHDASHFHDAPQSPSMSEISDHVDHLILKPSEISALMTGIGNMLINLKKKLCEIILSWNTRYVVVSYTKGSFNCYYRCILHED